MSLTSQPGQMPASAKTPLWLVLGDEGFRLFFPLAALHAALWPFLWVALHGLDLPLASAVPPTLWHAHEMVIGSYGAALIGFLSTAAPEFTDVTPLRRRPLFVLAGLWGVARLIGLVGWEGGLWLAALADLAWMGLLLGYMLWLSWRRQTDKLVAFMLWMCLLIGAEAVGRWGMIRDNYDLMVMGVYGAGFVFLGFLGIALGRIGVPVNNLILDPSEQTAPFRPHPGRINLASGLVAVAIVGELAGFSEAVRGFLWVAAGAGFLDRVAESFIGRAFFRVEILGLAASAALSGAGLLLYGAALLGAPFGTVPGLHLALMGGLGLGVMQVFAVAGLFHAGRSLPFPPGTALALLALVVSVLLRVAPDLGLIEHPFGVPYLLASMLWGAGLILWLWLYWPILTDRSGLGQREC